MRAASGDTTSCMSRTPSCARASRWATSISPAGGSSVLPRSRAEDGRLLEWMARATPDWSEAERKPGKRKGDPDQVWRLVPAPFPTAEGSRITWVHSSSKQRRDETARAERIERARRALQELSQRLSGQRARVTTRVAAEEAATALLASAAPSAGLRSRSPRRSRSATAKRSAAGPARTPATARPKDPIRARRADQRRADPL